MRMCPRVFLLCPLEFVSTKSLLYKHIQAWLLQFNMHHCFSFSFLPTEHNIFYYIEKILQKNLKKKTSFKFFNSFMCTRFISALCECLLHFAVMNIRAEFLSCFTTGRAELSVCECVCV